MQPETETFGDFLKRTDALALVLGLNVQDLPEVLDVSRASLFSYRTGNRPISSKAWRKLEQAERSAGITPEAASEPVRKGAKEMEHHRSGASTDDHFAGLPPEIRMAAEAIAASVIERLEARITRLETRLETLLAPKP
jgi:hypothetical protein